jgi:hypothetical protein
MKDHAQRYKNYTLRDQLKWPTRPIEDRMELYEKEKRTLEKKALVKDGKPVKMKAVKGESA